MLDIFRWTVESSPGRQAFLLSADDFDDRGFTATVEATLDGMHLRFETYFLSEEVHRFHEALEQLRKGSQLVASFLSFDENDELTVALASAESRDVSIQVVHGKSERNPPDLPHARGAERPTLFARVGWFTVERSYLETWIRVLRSVRAGRAGCQHSTFGSDGVDVDD